MDVCLLSHLSKNLLKQGKPPRNIFSIREEENDVAAGCRLTFCLSVQLDTIKLRVPAANKPAVQKADNGG